MAGILTALSVKTSGTRCSSTYNISTENCSATSVTLTASMLTHDLLHEANGRTYGTYPDVADTTARSVVLRPENSVLKQRYEWHGDKWLALFIGELLLEAFPIVPGTAVAPAGLISKVQSELQCNLLFSLLAVKLRMATIPFQKRSANTFEAYVHILRQDSNNHTLVPWLRGIFVPLITFFADHYVSSLRTFEDFRQARRPAQIVLVSAKGRKRPRLEQSASRKTTKARKIIAVTPQTDSHETPQNSTPYKTAHRKFNAKIVQISEDCITVDVQKLGLEMHPKIWLRHSVDTVEGHTFEETKPGTTIIWKPAPQEDDIIIEDEDEDEEDEMIIEGHSSSWAVGSVIQVWIPFENDKQDRSTSLIVAHPWDDRTVITDLQGG